MRMEKLSERELEEVYQNHDCLLGEEDGCEVCEQYFEIKAEKENQEWTELNAEKDVRDDALAYLPEGMTGDELMEDLIC
ncbi:MAG: hypothetical protein BWY74_00824 [Firmicutes bacterium ADurb.Bin419]|nr:MAG: hypothetical protein BWY74_00824 [Firmicutes bacterium ADurb.Bin419]